MQGVPKHGLDAGVFTGTCWVLTLKKDFAPVQVLASFCQSNFQTAIVELNKTMISFQGH